MPVPPLYFLKDLLDEWNTRPPPANFVAWNAHWERTLKRYGPNPSFNPAHTSQTIRMRRPRGPQDIVDAHTTILPLQQTLCRFSSHLLVLDSDNIIDLWVGLSKEEKKAYVLEIFNQFSGASEENKNDKEDVRNYCPELTIEYTVGDDRAIFHMLYQIMRGFIAGRSSEPVYIPHTGVDWLCESEDLREVGDTIRVQRMGLLTTFLLRLFLTINVAGEEAVIRQFRDGTMSAAWADSRFPMCVKKVERFLNLGTFCWNCSRRRRKGRKMKACIGCGDIGTSTIYCSSDCQANDWENGDPVPHKYICGRPDKLNKRFDINAILPSPLPSFKRSPNLEYVIEQLKECPEFDYMFSLQGQEFGVRWTDDLQKHRADFLVYRRRAVQTGERHAVTLMLRMLDFMAPGPNPTQRATMKGQLQDYFNVQISEDEIIEQYRPTAKEYAIVNQFLEAEI